MFWRRCHVRASPNRQHNAGHPITMRQQSLFAIREIPEGQVYKSDFLSVQEECDLLGLMQTFPFYEFKLHGVAAKRRVLHFGLRYALESRVLSTAPAIPSQFEPIRRRAAAFAGVAPDDFSQILVNEYRPGAGIGWHHDSPLFGIVAGISLRATSTMRFQHGSGEQQKTSALELPSRSIYLLTGDAVIYGSIASCRFGNCVIPSLSERLESNPAITTDLEKPAGSPPGRG